MLLFLALASLTTHNHLLINQFITQHRNTFSLAKKSRDTVLVGFTHRKEWQINMTLYIYVGHCFSDIYGQFIVGHRFSDMYGQIIVVHPSECFHQHCCFTLQRNTDKME